MIQGVYGIDVRNRDGLIMISDSNTGVWFCRMEGFNGKNGRDSDVPNVSSVQDGLGSRSGRSAPGQHT